MDISIYSMFKFHIQIIYKQPCIRLLTSKACEKKLYLWYF